jgi:CHAT domain
MNSSITKTLIALLLAIKELKTPLSKDEQANLQDIGQQLDIDPDYWDCIKEQITALIKGNYTLNQLFQAKIRKLDALDGRIPREFLPNFAEFKKELFGETKEIVTFDGSSNGENSNSATQIISITSTILQTENQDQTTKQLDFLEQIDQYVENYRYFNTYFAEPNNQIIIPASEPLIHGQTYFLCINISPEPQGIDTTTFPDKTLTQVWNNQDTLILDVAVTSKDFHINGTTKKLSLPRTGASDNLIFAIKPHKFSDRAYIQVELFYRGYLLQSKQLAILILPTVNADITESLRPLQSSRVTFTTTDLLTNEQLALLPERVLTVDVELDQRDGSIDFRFLDRTHGNEELAFYDTTLQPAALGNAIAGIRQQLKLTSESEYRWSVEGSMELLNTWLPSLANVGRELYRQLLPANQAEGSEKLQAALIPNTVIQVNPVLGKVTIPWALLYERKIRQSKQNRVCDRFTQHDLDCTGCPHKSDQQVVCPHAFWGYRYSIEQLPCWTSNKHNYPVALVRQIQNERQLQLSFNVYRNFELWQEHLIKLQATGSVNILPAEEMFELESIWSEHGQILDLVYFYCHGGIEEMPKKPYLEISDDRIYSNFLECYESTWLHHPLVFLNGCATGDYSPESYVSLIDDFLNAGASGVVGTECPVSETFAEYYATDVFQRLFAGEAMGQAMLAVRRNLLQQYYNPLGLVYSLYAAHEIALARSVTQN